jgi:hypothetical protein
MANSKIMDATLLKETRKILAIIFFAKTVSGMHRAKDATAILKSTANRRLNTFFANSKSPKIIPEEA